PTGPGGGPTGPGGGPTGPGGGPTGPGGGPTGPGGGGGGAALTAELTTKSATAPKIPTKLPRRTSLSRRLGFITPRIRMH
ncbi:MAG: hypothetical protein ACO35F_11690, partial [Ilumatobacteraceae bacterium]